MPAIDSMDRVNQMYIAVEDLRQAEDFFNRAEAHQLDFAIAQLNSAREKVNMLFLEAKGGDS